MAIGINNPFRLLQEIFVNFLTTTQPHTMIRPRWPLGLQIEAHPVGSREGSLRRTIAVETHVVQSVGLALLEDLRP